MSDAAHETLDDRLLHRLLFFSDAVFAIVLTILVLELRPPGGEHGSLGELRHHLTAFAGSFALIGVFWIAHMNITRQLAQFDWATAVANLSFLLPVCLIPFASAWIGQNIRGTTPWLAYCLVLILTSAMAIILVLVATRSGGRLMKGGVTPRERAYRVARAAVPGVAFTVGLLLLLSGHRILSFFCWMLIPLLFLLIGRVLSPRTTKAPAAA